MNPAVLVPVAFGSILGIFFTIHALSHWNERRHTYIKLYDLNDCPFSFKLSKDSYVDYVVFDFGDATLWCDFKFGIRKDGLYGISELTLKGINGTRGRNLDLNPGQSIFPIIKEMDCFLEWVRGKMFVYNWDSDFHYMWKDMKNSLDNLSYLETKSKEKEAK
jgi:hypothetical protein